mmetsp:Transcript_17803/g.54427  ORF Transcript_17803/g.54427 Transcript_17803/m.54427 type:complete len:133 (-) Transcript_17803:1238-1636(-)
MSGRHRIAAKVRSLTPHASRDHGGGVPDFSAASPSLLLSAARIASAAADTELRTIARSGWRRVPSSAAWVVAVGNVERLRRVRVPVCAECQKPGSIEEADETVLHARFQQRAAAKYGRDAPSYDAAVISDIA